MIVKIYKEKYYYNRKTLRKKGYEELTKEYFETGERFPEEIDTIENINTFLITELLEKLPIKYRSSIDRDELELYYAEYFDTLEDFENCNSYGYNTIPLNKEDDENLSELIETL